MWPREANDFLQNHTASEWGRFLSGFSIVFLMLPLWTSVFLCWRAMGILESFNHLLDISEGSYSHSYWYSEHLRCIGWHDCCIRSFNPLGGKSEGANIPSSDEMHNEESYSWKRESLFPLGKGSFVHSSILVLNCPQRGRTWAEGTGLLWPGTGLRCRYRYW